MSNNFNAGPAKVVKEKVLAVRGGWLISGRVVIYHNSIRRAELTMKKDPSLGIQEVGFVHEDLQMLAELLGKYRAEVGE